MTLQKIIIVGVLVLLAAFLIRLLTWKKKAPGPSDLNADMAGLAERAVKFAKEKGVTLDYSKESVEHVEQILAVLHESRSKGQLPDPDLHVYATRFGAYIGEVLRRMHGGHWTQNSDVAGPDSFPIHWDGGQSFPIAWCGKRIINGDEDNVWFKFQVVTSEEYRRDTLTPKSEEKKSGE
jgi:hypothetical protein